MSGGIPISEISGSAATDALHETIKAFQEASTRQTTMIIRLTWAMLALTLVMVGVVGVQTALLWQ